MASGEWLVLEVMVAPPWAVISPESPVKRTNAWHPAGMYVELVDGRVCYVLARWRSHENAVADRNRRATRRHLYAPPAGELVVAFEEGRD